MTAQTPARPNELRIVRVYDAPIRAVWDAWTVLEQVERWWGPRGFTLTTHSKDLRPGGTWRYTMHGPDGVDYPNVATYHEVEPLRRLVYDHGATDHTPPLFRVTATFTETTPDRTTLELISAFPSPEVAAEMRVFIKQAGGLGTWDRLAEHLEERTSGKATFVVNRTFEAPIDRVFTMWTDPEHLARWLPPAGTELRFLRSRIEVGHTTFFAITGSHGALHVRAEYLAIERPTRIVYAQQFVDEHERPALPPGSEAWPPTLLMTIRLAEEGPGATRVTVVAEPYGETSAAELAAFVAERPGMTLGWNGSFDALDELLA